MSMNFSTSAKATISSNLRAISVCFMPRMAPFRKMFSRPVSSGWKPVPTSSSEPTRPQISTRPSVGSVMRRQNLQQRALAGTVAADDADHFAALDFERDVLQRPDCGLIMAAISVGRMLRSRAQAAKGRGHRVRDHVADRFVGLAFSDLVPLRESFAAYGYVSHKPQGLKPLVSFGPGRHG